DDVIMPLVRHWRVFEAEGMDSDGERARQDLAAALEALDARAARFVERRAEAQAARRQPIPSLLGADAVVSRAGAGSRRAGTSAPRPPAGAPAARWPGRAW